MRVRVTSRSRFRGVRWCEHHQRWLVVVDRDGQRPRYVAALLDEIKAAEAHDRVMLGLYGRARPLNFPPARGLRPSTIEQIRAEARAALKGCKACSYRGVVMAGASWIAQINLRSRGSSIVPLGRWASAVAAARAYDRAARFYFGATAILNFPKRALPPAGIMELRRESLRERKKTTSSRYLGVTWHVGVGRWRAFIRYAHRMRSLGMFRSEVAAARAYDREASRLRGERARLNFDPKTGDELFGRPCDFAREARPTRRRGA